MRVWNALDVVVTPTCELLARHCGIITPDIGKVMLLTIALQESALEHREQMGGSAHGFWQFEIIACREILSNPRTRRHIEAMRIELVIPPGPVSLYRAAVHNDVLACTLARLLLLLDPEQLPVTAGQSWAYYLRNWRPGRPHPETWQRHWLTALDTVFGPPTLEDMEEAGSTDPLGPRTG